MFVFILRHLVVGAWYDNLNGSGLLFLVKHLLVQTSLTQWTQILHKAAPEAVKTSENDQGQDPECNLGSMKRWKLFEALIRTRSVKSHMSPCLMCLWFCRFYTLGPPARCTSWRNKARSLRAEAAPHWVLNHKPSVKQKTLNQLIQK